MVEKILLSGDNGEILEIQQYDKLKIKLKCTLMSGLLVMSVILGMLLMMTNLLGNRCCVQHDNAMW